MKAVVFSLLLAFGVLAHASDMSHEMSSTEAQALALLKKLPASNHGSRKVCIYMGRMVVGVYNGGQNWSQNMVVMGTVDRFPTEISKLNQDNVKWFTINYPTNGDRSRFKLLEKEGSVKYYSGSGMAFGRPADVCVFEERSTLE